uniref:T9SS type A sorting domain-containing protein n=1 Tax=Flavobacterium sp. TaxID=239 RepID=UPI0040494B1D
MVEKIFINTSSFPELNLKNGNNLILFSANYESEIAFICVDPGEFSIIENGLSNEEFTTVIHPYCTFVLGGEYYEITGDILVELGNGCMSYENAPIFDLQFTLTDGSNTDIFYPNSTNNYSYTLPEGNHELTSQLIDLDLWTVSPSSINLSFPLDSSPYVQNFCITPSSTFNDAEIILIPLNSGIPGMQANYKLIYKNKGNTMLSGSVDLLFNDDVMNFLAASTNVNYQSTGNLSWNYTNLMPFETREISFSMLLNTPTDPNFPLNLEDLLNYTATINNSNPDETPNNNTFTLNQTILNSYDPNDIRCLEGNTLAIDQVGDYVHYLIRFENIGTSNASNVVIKDILDATKFDYSTLVPLNASHNFYTRIVNGNEVEFIFENIQLPFDDADNDGYVVFKIKTLETLLLGDSFSNQAAIYFDFNFPIITNNETTSIVDESLSNNVFNNLPISIFPNPTKNNLNIQSKSAILKISIYDLNGRLLNNVQPNSNQTEYKLDVENLSNGVYFLNVHAGKTKQILKFVKN